MNNIALIGFGRMGQMHFNILNELEEFNVKYIIDHKIKAEQKITPLSELETILQDESLNGVVIATSSDAHVEMIDLCSKYQKHIFCEKPVSYQVETLQDLNRSVMERGAQVQVGLNRRFDPHYVSLQQQLKQDVIGEPQVIKITNRDPKRPDLEFVKRSGGLIYDFVIHDLDMLNFLSSKSVVDISIMVDALIEPKFKKLNDVDTAIISLKLEGGAMVVIDVSRESGIGYDQRIEVLGNKGMLKVDNQYSTTLQHSNKNGRCAGLPHFSFVERYFDAYQAQFKSFAELISGELSKPKVGLSEMIAAVALADRVSAQM